ncbi:microfibril-associated glycoprotein 4-like [Amphiura filiformis]|uniref:microfibril-associated glycoprotein 4-like n=1 Tax=Amphiura filiformis TaxID=82378 RepID=UPI003B21F489
MALYYCNMLLCVIASASLYGFASCNPGKRSIDSAAETVDVPNTDAPASEEIVEECIVDPGLERRTILLEQAATTWGATLPPMLDRLSEISNAMQTPPVVTEPTGMDCTDLFAQGHTTSGIYKIGSHHHSITPHDSFYAYCDMTTDAGGWTVFLRRFEGTADFYLGWDAYATGFGHLNSDHWLGLKQIHLLTSLAKYELRVDLEAFDGSRAYAKYDTFRISDAIDNYKLSLGTYSGDAGNALLPHDGQAFTTKDRDNDNHNNPGNCASQYHGAWWYDNCFGSNGSTGSNLNGLYQSGQVQNDNGMVWTNWKGSEVLKVAEMKIRRK